jgi:peptide/nickel transport system permease protein
VDLLGPRLLNSRSSPLLAFVICIPLSILGGVIAALRYGKATDKSITIAGLSLASMPDYVSGIILILVFGIWLGWLPVTAPVARGSRAAHSDRSTCSFPR